jgi:hypothetical protein
MDAINQCLSFHAAWKGQEVGGTVTISTDFGPEVSNQSDFNVLKFTRRLGDISRKAYLSELQRRGTLQDDYDEEADFLQIEEEVKLGLSKLMVDEEDDENVESDIGKTETGDAGSGASGAAG